MWKVGDVEPVRVMGADGYPYMASTSPRKTASPLSLRNCDNRATYHFTGGDRCPPRRKAEITTRLVSIPFRTAHKKREAAAPQPHRRPSNSLTWSRYPRAP
jgi:hypothetical protein